jgi:hypothetical protein
MDPKEEGRTRLVVIHGWPGVGKTTFASSLAYEPTLRERFSDVVLWASLGPASPVEDVLRTWAKQLGLDTAGSAEDLAARIRYAIRGRAVLIVVDDAWNAHDATTLLVGDSTAAHIVTTREPETARRIADTPNQVRSLDVLTAGAAFALFSLLAPTAAKRAPGEVTALLQALEHLPLSIKVAAGLTEDHTNAQLPPEGILQELRSRGALLDKEAPSARRDADGRPMTVEAILALSTERLDERTRERFASLGVLERKPATFKLRHLRAKWGDGADETVAKLVGRGLIEPQPPDSYWIHSLLADHAERMLYA